MINKFDPAMEDIITKQYENGECSIQTFVNMMIGKYGYLQRLHALKEIEDQIFGHRISDHQKCIEALQYLEKQIEDLEDDISYFLHKIENDAKN